MGYSIEINDTFSSDADKSDANIVLKKLYTSGQVLSTVSSVSHDAPIGKSNVGKSKISWTSMFL